MNTEQLLLEAAVNDPTGNAMLVYADWLDQVGDPRGHILRLSCELRKTLADYEINETWLERCGVQVERAPVPLGAGKKLSCLLINTVVLDVVVMDVAVELSSQPIEYESFSGPIQFRGETSVEIVLSCVSR